MELKKIKNEKVIFPVAALFICVIWALWAGKDLNWDAINYHYYLPFSLFKGRLTQDYFPASVQSYLNPIPYIPFYLLVESGAPSAVVSICLAALHSINLWLIYLIARQLLPKKSTLTIALAMLLAAASILFWSQVGSSFSDIITSIFILYALWRLIESLSSERKSYLFWAGASMGVGVGLKLTCLPFALAMVFAWLVFSGFCKSISRLFVLIVGGGVGVAISGGYWWYRIWKEFGNPFFPLLNNIFHSDLFPYDPVTIDRFVPKGLLGYLGFPFRLLLPDSWVYTEVIAPDIRPLTLLISMALLFFGVCRSAFPRHLLSRQLRMVLVFFVLSVGLWQLTSGNGRYALPLFLMMGVLIVVVTSIMFSEKVASVLSFCVILIQLTTQVMASEVRWNTSDWGRDWYDVEIPELLRSRPSLYLSMDTNSWSFLAGKFHPKSSLININGQYALSLSGPSGKRVQYYLEKYKGSVRMLKTIEGPMGEDASFHRWVEERNQVLARFGFKIDTDDCAEIIVHLTSSNNIHLASCHLEVAAAAKAAYYASIKEVEPFFDRIEKICGAKLRPTGAAIIAADGLYSKHYMDDDSTIIIDSQRMMLHQFHSLKAIDLGAVENWRHGIPREALNYCTR